MFKYFHIIKFLMTHDLTFLKECWEAEFVRKKFSWASVIRRLFMKRNRNFYFWWRIANEMFIYGGKKQKKRANKINYFLKKRYAVEIGLGACIGAGLSIFHFEGVIINANVKIGRNFKIMQFTTIGLKEKIEKITIGDNVSFGAMCCIIGDKLTIGDNVVVGAMSFINKDIPSNCTVYTEKTNKIIINQA